jgi:hypothetical protein
MLVGMVDPVAVLASSDASDSDILDALAALRVFRRELDAAERGLIERARESAVPWPRIASALGLASRQAAEQRLLRLSASDGRDPVAARRQRSVDVLGGTAVVDLRRAVRRVNRQILADPSWDGRHARAALARASLSMAETAPPGAMYSLVEAALDDVGPAAVPTAVAEALDALRSALDAARPSPRD